MDQKRLQQIKQRYRVMGNCDQLNHALDVCLQVASTDLSVLIIGESGVGKEVLPRIIHDNSRRSRGKYLAINCGSIPEGTIDSELFGHEKGSFTGAIGESEGYFGLTNGGTLFLDEVGELPLATQARLLRVLETGEYIRVGGQEVRRTDVRIVAATNVNMRKAVSEGKFREDLYYRLNTIPVTMPPLRDRGNDILFLFRFFAMEMMEKYKLPRIELTPEAQRLLLKYKWPGNIRQLKNITEQMSILSEERTITAEMMLRFIPDDKDTMAITTKSTTATGGDHSYASERQLLFNMLFELQNKVVSMNDELQELRQQIVALGGTVKTSGKMLALPPAPSQLPQPADMASYPGVGGTHVDMGYADLDTQTMDVSVEDADVEELPSAAVYADGAKSSESLNVHENELEQIRKALARNGGNRKKAAEELGISDRTLYRRLKAHNLE